MAGCAAAAGPAHRPAPRGADHTRPVVDPVVSRTMVLGYSVRHRPIIAIELGDPDSPRRALVVGAIHGSEPAGIAVAVMLARGSPPAQADLWIVPDLNPDGVAAGTRQDARGVDLNRNFPWRWRPLGPPGSLFYAGPRPLSEPESRVAARLIARIRPGLAIWYHQALNVVDDSQGPQAAERRYAAPAAFVVELPAGPLSPAGVRRHVAALRVLLRCRVTRRLPAPSWFWPTATQSRWGGREERLSPAPCPFLWRSADPVVDAGSPGVARVIDGAAAAGQAGDDLAVGQGEQLAALAVGDGGAQRDGHPEALVEGPCGAHLAGIGMP